MKSPVDRTHYIAAEHVIFMDTLLQGYDRNRNSLMIVFGDNCAVNKLMCSMMGVPLFGCYNHRLERAVKVFAEKEIGSVFTKVAMLLKKFRDVKLAGALEKLTKVKAITHNKTRWFSRHRVIRKYFILLPHLSAIAATNPTVSSMLPTTVENLALQAFLKKAVTSSLSVKHSKQMMLQY